MRSTPGIDRQRITRVLAGIVAVWLSGVWCFLLCSVACSSMPLGNEVDSGEDCEHSCCNTAPSAGCEDRDAPPSVSDGRVVGSHSSPAAGDGSVDSSSPAVQLPCCFLVPRATAAADAPRYCAAHESLGSSASAYVDRPLVSHLLQSDSVPIRDGRHTYLSCCVLLI